MEIFVHTMLAIAGMLPKAYMLGFGPIPLLMLEERLSDRPEWAVNLATGLWENFLRDCRPEVREIAAGFFGRHLSHFRRIAAELRREALVVLAARLRDGRELSEEERGYLAELLDNFASLPESRTKRGRGRPNKPLAEKVIEDSKIIWAFRSCYQHKVREEAIWETADKLRVSESKVKGALSRQRAYQAQKPNESVQNRRYVLLQKMPGMLIKDQRKVIEFLSILRELTQKLPESGKNQERTNEFLPALHEFFQRIPTLFS